MHTWSKDIFPSCASENCCSKYGYSGTTAPYCGDGCQQGPCYSSIPTTPTPSGGYVSVRSLVTDSFFNGIINQAGSGCAGKSFYSKNAFLTALNSYPQFGTGGSADVTKREVAAFFAHVTHETGHFCYIEEIAKATNCQPSATWPCNPSKQYYGRGPIQISWNYNYGPAGRSIGFGGLRNTVLYTVLKSKAARLYIIDCIVQMIKIHTFKPVGLVICHTYRKISHSRTHLVHNI